MEILNPFPVEVVEENKTSDATAKTGGNQPTAEEMSGLTFMKLPDLSIRTQELRNRFAHLLNRGSSLE